ncbi:FAD-dependent oxidoreductase [Mesorhizobium sp. B263B2A]|uniref:FAD-dependent oxidoreductase n=1 Tax=Mesorhizobium sp. B263B2A TaxID=2876669 RepID=UPI00398EABF9
MIEDCDGVRQGACLEADLCIVGAGAAGLALASQFEGTRHRICIIESGGLTYEHRRQRLSRGRSVGRPYEALDLCRIRQFGGSTGRAGWGGWCKMLDHADFEPRSWIPMSGWPVDRNSLLPHYEAAAGLLGIDDLQAEWPASAALPMTGPLFSERCFLSPVPDLGATLRARLQRAKNVQVFLHATALRLDTDASGRWVRSIEVASTPNRRFRIQARSFVLACGGIENARLLLVSNRQMPNGIGNQHDLVGRYFMEHPRVKWGSLQVGHPDTALALHVPSIVARRPYLSEQEHCGVSGAFGLALRPEIRESERLLGSRTWIKPGPCANDLGGSEALHYLAFWLRKGRLHRDLIKSGRTILRHPAASVASAIERLGHSRGRVRHFHFDTILEQEPDPESRVTLDTRLDEFNLPRVKLEWRVGPLVRRTLERVQTIITDEMRLLGHRSDVQLSAHETPTCGDDIPYRWVRHHMGTTRMSADPRTGVVDATCQVHGLGNLFVAGSSVFPTGGNDMPTLTIVALAIKLGRHLRQWLE